MAVPPTFAGGGGLPSSLALAQKSHWCILPHSLFIGLAGLPLLAYTAEGRCRAGTHSAAPGNAADGRTVYSNDGAEWCRTVARHGGSGVIVSKHTID